MAGCFNNPEWYEYNVVEDIPAAKKVFSEWPTPLVTSPFEVGMAIHYPATSIENDFKWAAEHPLVDAYRCYHEMPYDRPTWDLTSVLYVVEGPPISMFLRLARSRCLIKVQPRSHRKRTGIGITFRWTPCKPNRSSSVSFS